MKIDEKKLGEIAKKFKIKYIVLFGSYTKNYVWKESDVDIAVKIEKLPSAFEEKLRLKVNIEKGIEKLVKKDVEVVFINELNPGFKFEIISEGKLLFVENKEEWIEDKARIIASYHDYKEFIREFEEKLMR